MNWRADSAGYRAGKDGKDLGADMDLVGPDLRKLEGDDGISAEAPGQVK
jgi:hypothetical protein